MAKIDPANWHVERLGRQHNRTRFDCGQSTLNDWLQRSAGQFDRRGYSRTFVATLVGEVDVLGYYALSNHTLRFETLPDHAAKGLPRIDVPVILLGRLAIDRSMQGHGLGSLLLFNAFHRITQIAEQVGIRAVEVDAIDEAAKTFYQRFGFTELRDDPRHLYLSLEIVRQWPTAGT